MKKHYNLLALIILVASCTEPININKLPDYNEKIAINASLNDQQLLEFTLSNSTNAYLLNSPSIIKNATITLKEDGVTKVVTFDDNTNKYFADFIPKPNSVYNISVQYGNYPVISAMTTMPSTISNKKTNLIIKGGLDATGVPSDLLSISWKDVGAERNFYKINFKYYSDLAGQFLPFDFQANDPVFTSNNALKANDGGYIFNDASFNGKEKTIAVVAPFGLVSPTQNDKYLIELRNISEEYYKYITTLQRFRDAQDFNQGLFDETIVVYSNINNGLGIFAGTVLSSDTIR